MIERLLQKAIPCAAALCALFPSTAQAQSEDQTILNIFNQAVFYDGYDSEVRGADLDDGILRHTNYVYGRRLEDAELDMLGSSLTLDIIIQARCDDFDRIGNINVAFVPKGAETYAFDEVERIEVARFITPFMNYNKSPREVPYSFDSPLLSMMLRDAELRSRYDFWMEFEVFGIPYDAQNKVVGCRVRSDTFGGTLDFVTEDNPAGPAEGTVLVPVVMKKTEIFGPVNFNNYREEACDTLGVATKTWAFEMPESVSDARLVLITSNHGAARFGEEYIHRRHLAYFDGDIALDYTPGGVSCEPYRQYNTMGNGIYSSDLEGDMDFWLNYSNWCPGGPIPVREIELGPLSAGKHEFMLRVPDAVFFGESGDFYVSAYVQGVRTGSLPASVGTLAADAGFTFTREGDTLLFSGAEAAEAAVYTFDGQLVSGHHRPGGSISLAPLPQGLYIVSVRLADGRASVYKFSK